MFKRVNNQQYKMFDARWNSKSDHTYDKAFGLEDSWVDLKSDFDVEVKKVEEFMPKIIKRDDG